MWPSNVIQQGISSRRRMAGAICDVQHQMGEWLCSGSSPGSHVQCLFLSKPTIAFGACVCWVAPSADLYLQHAILMLQPHASQSNAGWL